MRSMRSRIALALVLTAAVASADAPSDQYEQYSPQATDIQDHYARLDWQRFLTLPLQDQNSALKACAQSFARLPTYRELLTLVDENPHDEWDPSAGTTSPRYIDPNAFPATPVGVFWSMSPGADPTKLKVVDFESGMSRDSHPGEQGWVRCVTDL